MLSHYLEQLRVIIEQIILSIGYPGIALIMLAENLFPPIPSELVMPFAGFIAADGRLNIVAAIIAGTLGSLLGAVALYYIGLALGEPLVRPFFRRYGKWFLLSEEDLDKALATFGRYGQLAVFVGRMIPIVRSLISLPAGMYRMPMLPFLFYSAIGSAIWTTILTVAGYFLGANWQQVLGIIDTYQNIVLALLVVMVVVFVVRRLLGMRRNAGLNA